jgi:hypothetical protein
MEEEEKGRCTLPLLVLMLTGIMAALSCGAGQTQLQSMSLSPAVADAKNFPDGKVQFTATGYYINPTHMVTPQSANWVACTGNLPTTAVSVTTAGVVQCGSGASGTYSINAWNPLGPGTYSCPSQTNQTACGGGCKIEATAQLTCP